MVQIPTRALKIDFSLLNLAVELSKASRRDSDHCWFGSVVYHLSNSLSIRVSNPSFYQSRKEQSSLPTSLNSRPSKAELWKGAKAFPLPN